MLLLFYCCCCYLPDLSVGWWSVGTVAATHSVVGGCFFLMFRSWVAAGITVVDLGFLVDACMSVGVAVAFECWWCTSGFTGAGVGCGTGAFGPVVVVVAVVGQAFDCFL